MKRHPASIANFLHHMVARMGRSRCLRRISVPVLGVARRLSLLVVVLAVVAAPLVFAAPSSAHEVPPTYECSPGGTLEGTECVATTSTTSPATVSYWCSSGTLSGTECETTTSPATVSYWCSSGTLSGTECETSTTMTTPATVSYWCSSGTPNDDNECETSTTTTTPATVSYSCSSGTLKGTECETSTTMTTPATVSYSCSSGTLKGTECETSTTMTTPATVSYSCSSGTLKGTECETITTAAATAECSAGTLTNGQCQETAAPTWTCSAGTRSGTSCLETASPSYTCTEGEVTGDQCLESANPTYSCAEGSLSGSQCQHTTSPDYSCTKGTLSGTSCVETHTPVCTLNDNFVPCDTPGVTYHCDTGFTLSGSTCIKTTAATANCPSGYLTGNFGICYKYTAASSDCPAGFPPPSQGLCFKYSAAKASCDTGFTLSNSQCTRTTAAVASCTTGYQLDSFDLEGTPVTYCYRNTPPTYKCSTGKLTNDNQCETTTTTPADISYSCDSGMLNGTQCEITTTTKAPADVSYSCDSGTLNGTQCEITTTTTTAAEVSYSCSTGTLNASNQCSETTTTKAPAEVRYSCDSGTLNASNQCVETTTTTTAAEVRYSCSTGELNADNQCEHPAITTPAEVRYSCDSGMLNASNECEHTTTTRTPARPLCSTGNPNGANCDHTHPTISGLPATAKRAAGTPYTITFTVSPANATVLASGEGCELSPPSTTGIYTLTVTRTDAGTRTCNVAAVDTASTTATITIRFGELTLDPSLGAPTWPWVTCSADGKQFSVNWTGVTEATGYQAEEDSGDLADWSGTSTSFTAASNPGEYYRVRIRSTGANNTVSSWSRWAGGGCAVPAPSGLSVVCRASGELAVSWDVVAGASQYTATITSTKPPPPPVVPRKLTRHLRPSSPNSEAPNSLVVMGATAGWTYAVVVKVQVNNNWSPDSASVSDTCEAVVPPKPTGVAATCVSGVLTVTWNKAGAGLAKATSYKPRIFTGNPLTESTKWTANTAGHDTITATIPSTGEDDLPATGTFQVKVKATNSAGDSPYSDPAEATCGLNPVSGLKAICRNDGKLRVAWEVAEWYRQSPTSRQFAIEVDGVHVRDEAASGLAEQAYEWDSAEVDRRHKVRVQARTLGTHTPEEYPWTAQVTANKCPQFVPQKVTASCNSHGVVKANWDAVNGASSYRVDWRPQHEVGSNEIRTTTAVDPTWQEDEGGIYQLAVAAYTDANRMWSDYTAPITVTCNEVTLPSSWLSPNTPGYDPEDARSSIYFNELVTRFCPVTVTGERTERICTEVWNEAVLISLDGQSWWKDLPLTSWSNFYDAANNVRTLFQVAGILRARLSSGSLSTQGQVKIAKIGHKQGQATLIVRSDGSESLVMSAHFPGPNPPVVGQPPITGCLEPTYVHRSITLDPISVTDGNHTNQRNVTIHYCIRSDLAQND